MDYILISICILLLGLVFYARHKEILSWFFPGDWFRVLMNRSDGRRSTWLVKKPKSENGFMIWRYKGLPYWLDGSMSKPWGRTQSWEFFEGKTTPEKVEVKEPEKWKLFLAAFQLMDDKQKKEAVINPVNTNIILPSENAKMLDDWNKQENYKMFDRQNKLFGLDWIVWIMIALGVVIALNYFGIIHLTAAGPAATGG